jgi:Ca2+-binding RTX toxin-like protein
MDHHHHHRQKQFSSKSPLGGVALAIFTGVIVLLVIPSAPVLVFAANIQGTPGDDTLNGTPKTDTIKGFEGDDKLFGKDGKDILDGGVGSDEIYGGPGNDKIKEPDDLDATNKVYGGSGDDKIDIDTSSGNGVLYFIYGEDGSDYIEVISNEGIVDGGLDDDTIYCTAQFCALNGNQGNDEIHIESSEISSAYALGGSGNDKLYSRGSQDLKGNDGNDYLFGAAFQEGGAGDDYLEEGAFSKGGPGADTFKCSGTVVEDYNPEEGDIIINPADCQTIEEE